MRTLLALLLFSLPAWGVCVNLASGGDTRSGPIWTCPSTGDPAADGADLRLFLSGLVGGVAGNYKFVCGDTIILQAGAEYYTPVISGLMFNFFLTDQPSCTPGKRTRVVSSRAGEMPWEYRPVVADIPRMAVLRSMPGNAQGGSNLSTFPQGSNGWLFEGIAFSSHLTWSTTAHAYLSGTMVNTSQYVTRWPESFSSNMEFYHCLITNGEEEFYGTLAACKTIKCPIRSTKSSFGPGGSNIKITSSSTYGQGGFVPNYGSVFAAIVSPTFVDYGGIGYAVGDTFSINAISSVDGTTPLTSARGTVTTVVSGRVTGFNVTTAGTGGYAVGDPRGTTAITGGGSGLQVNITAVSGGGAASGITAASISVGDSGSGYSVGDAFTINGGLPGVLATGTVATETLGHVLTVTITYGGLGYDPAVAYRVGTVATSGSGSGLILILTDVGDSIHLPVNTATNGNTPTITYPGISAILGVSPEVGVNCHDSVTGRRRCTRTCSAGQTPQGCNFILVEGFPSDWITAGVAGVIYAIYVDANTVALSKATVKEQSLKSPGDPIDTTGLSTYTGGAVFRPGGPKLDPIYQVIPSTLNNFQVVNSYLENGDMTWFQAAGGPATSQGTVTASTWDGTAQEGTIDVTVSSALTINYIYSPGYTGSKVGDFIAFYPLDGAGMSIYCSGPTDAHCRAGGRGAKITAISGTFPNLHFTVVPVGAVGMDGPAKVGGLAQWEGILSQRVLLSRGTIYRDPRAFPTGKGAFENKSTALSLYDGMIYTGTPYHETKNQATGGAGTNNDYFRLKGSGVPWATCVDSFFSNSLQIDGGFAYFGYDYESFNVSPTNCWYENNLAPGTPVYVEYPAIWQQFGMGSGGFRHNTHYVDVANSPRDNWYVNFYTDLTCPNTGPPSIQDLPRNHSEMYDNIISFGEGYKSSAAGYDCWPNQHTGAISHNAFIADGSVSTSSILSLWPLSNTAVTDVPAIQFECGTIAACKTAPLNIAAHALAPTSPVKGTASDGKDPGADVLQIDDRIHGWSEDARILCYDSITNRKKYCPSALQLGATHAALTFQIFSEIGNCKLTLYTNGSRVTEHTDTITVGRKECGRSGNLFQNRAVSFVLGTNGVLSAGTTYYWKLTDGTRTMVGEFTTPAGNSTMPVSLSMRDAAATDALIQYSSSADMSSPSTTTPVSFASSRVILTHTPASGVTYWRWQKRDGGGAVLQSGPVSVAIRGTAATTTSWVTGITPGGVDNSITGALGAQITVGASPVTVLSLGRYCVSGNSGTHTLGVYLASTGALIDSTTVNMSGCSGGQFVYSAPVSIALSASTAYFVASSETSGGDQWLDVTTTVTTTSVGTDDQSVYFSGAWGGGTNPGHQYVGVSFKY